MEKPTDHLPLFSNSHMRRERDTGEEADGTFELNTLLFFLFYRTRAPSQNNTVAT
jgi:hypothetical protein